jgi:hypothetical protein
MSPRSDHGSTTKELPMGLLHQTLRLVTPGMTYDQLRAAVLKTPGAHTDTPALVTKRFLRRDASDRIEYNGVLTLVRAHGITDARVRKVMFFVWFWRDERLRNFIVEQVSDSYGRWRPKELTNKDNWKFFTKYMSSSSAMKTRSNVEFFLTQFGVFDPGSGKVHLDLSDGWLSDAIAIIAPDEKDPRRRAAMLQDPVGFLVSQQLNGFINLPTGTYVPNYPGELESIDVVDDLRIPFGGPGKGDGKSWKPRDIKAGSGTPLEISVDIVARERASKAHQDLERIAAAAIKAKGYEPLFTQSIDMYFNAGAETVLLEMKSCHADNVHSQIRKGVSQLLEYRYLHRDAFQPSKYLALVLETPPAGDKRWLTDYLESVGVFPTWRHPSEEALVSAKKVPPSLDGIVFPAG